MKYIHTLLLSLLISYSVQSQITDTANNIGIGTITPLAPLQINQVEDSSSDRALMITEENNSEIIYLHLANNSSGQYGFFHLGGTTNLRGNGQHSSFDGALGIGTSSPNMKLHLDNLADYDGIQFGSKFKIRQSGINDNHFVMENIADSGSLYLRARGSASSNVTGSLVLNDSGGNVGIGETSPVAKLSVKADAITSKGEKLLDFTVNDSDDYLRLINATQTGNQFIPAFQSYRGNDNRESLFLLATTNEENDNGSNALMVFDSRQTTKSIENRPLFSWRSYGASKMTLNANGNLGIGTTEVPDSVKLGVNGKIAATEVKVALIGNWPDFVFEEDYKLPTLKEVEDHVNENGHLENIPNAKEVAENGFFLGEMDSKLLQKIEELTLYTIAQEKQIKKLTKENEASKLLQEQLLALAKRVDELENSK